MRLFLINIIFIQLIFGGLVGTQLSKVSYLLEHLDQYQMIEKGNVLDFIVLHYGNSDHTKSSKDQHKLPFHELRYDYASFTYYFKPIEKFHLFYLADLTHFHGNGQRSFHPYKFLVDVFKPPIA